MSKRVSATFNRILILGLIWSYLAVSFPLVVQTNVNATINHNGPSLASNPRPSPWSDTITNIVGISLTAAALFVAIQQCYSKYHGWKRSRESDPPTSSAASTTHVHTVEPCHASETGLQDDELELATRAGDTTPSAPGPMYTNILNSTV